MVVPCHLDSYADGSPDRENMTVSCYEFPEAKREVLREIDAELRATGLTHYLENTYRSGSDTVILDPGHGRDVLAFPKGAKYPIVIARLPTAFQRNWAAFMNWLHGIGL